MVACQGHNIRGDSKWVTFDASEYKHEIVRDGPEEFTVAEALHASCGSHTSPKADSCRSISQIMATSRREDIESKQRTLSKGDDRAVPSDPRTDRAGWQAEHSVPHDAGRGGSGGITAPAPSAARQSDMLPYHVPKHALRHLVQPGRDHCPRLFGFGARGEPVPLAN